MKPEIESSTRSVGGQWKTPTDPDKADGPRRRHRARRAETRDVGADSPAPAKEPQRARQRRAVPQDEDPTMVPGAGDRSAHPRRVPIGATHRSDDLTGPVPAGAAERSARPLPGGANAPAAAASKPTAPKAPEPRPAAVTSPGGPVAMTRAEHRRALAALRAHQQQDVDAAPEVGAAAPDTKDTPGASGAQSTNGADGAQGGKKPQQPSASDTATSSAPSRAGSARKIAARPAPRATAPAPPGKPAGRTGSSGASRLGASTTTGAASPSVSSGPAQVPPPPLADPGSTTAVPATRAERNRLRRAAEERQRELEPQPGATSEPGASNGPTDRHGPSAPTSPAAVARAHSAAGGPAGEQSRPAASAPRRPGHVPTPTQVRQETPVPDADPRRSDTPARAPQRPGPQRPDAGPLPQHDHDSIFGPMPQPGQVANRPTGSRGAPSRESGAGRGQVVAGPGVGAPDRPSAHDVVPVRMPTPPSAQPSLLGPAPRLPALPTPQRVPEAYERLSHRPGTHRALRFLRQLSALVRSDRTPGQLAESAQRIQAPVGAGRRVAVVGAVGGAAATTSAVLLARVLAGLRPDRIAVLARHDLGNELALRTGSNERPNLHTGLVDPPGGFGAIDEATRTCAVTVADLGTDLTHALVAHSDVVVITTVATVAGVHAAAEAVDALRVNGVSRASILVNVIDPGWDSGLSLSAAASECAAPDLRVITTARDRHLAGSGAVDLELLAEPALLSAYQLGAAVIEIATAPR